MDVVYEIDNDWEQQKNTGTKLCLFFSGLVDLTLCSRYTKLLHPQHIRKEIATEERYLKKYVCNIVSWRLIPITGYLFLKAMLNVAS